jgi:hypothetical protein
MTKLRKGSGNRPLRHYGKRVAHAAWADFEEANEETDARVCGSRAFAPNAWAQGTPAVFALVESKREG